MSERSSDIPNFDTYPASPPERLTPVNERSTLEQRAAELGAAAGRIATVIRQVQERVADLPNYPISDRVNDLAENVKSRADELRQRATSRTQEFAQVASEMSAKIGEQTREGLDRARIRARVAVRDYPVHVALAAGAAGFLIGVGLRIRRANRAY
jgi:ElaB/YqjD/DUF883 family membrane-anchored ribosome-binding protein